MNIDIILPYKEIFSGEKASSVSLTVKNALEFSKFKSQINVFGQFTNSPFKNTNFFGIKTNKFLHFGNNNSLLINYLEIKKQQSPAKRILELHNRPYVFNLAVKKEKNIPITLHYHNDPREMKGSKSVIERILIAKNAAAVYFVSNYIKKCFLDGINENFNNLHVIPNGIQRKKTDLPKKKKQVVFIGRIVPEKGCHLFVDSIKSIVERIRSSMGFARFTLSSEISIFASIFLLDLNKIH